MVWLALLLIRRLDPVVFLNRKSAAHCASKSGSTGTTGLRGASPARSELGMFAISRCSHCPEALQVHKRLESVYISAISASAPEVPTFWVGSDRRLYPKSYYTYFSHAVAITYLSASTERVPSLSHIESRRFTPDMDGEALHSIPFSLSPTSPFC
ncbi:hypothetical protein B0H12DRAFT_1139846 [Mycena haematopus]|nr:hypothetical protein B0H12DRAFT_1139846 [Mycena haematopus]